MTLLKMPWRKGNVIRQPWQVEIESCDKDGTIVGWCFGMSDGEVTYLTDLFVREDVRGQGHGTYLVQRFIKDTEGTTVILLTSDADTFYTKFGFRPRMAMMRRPA